MKLDKPKKDELILDYGCCSSVCSCMWKNKTIEQYDSWILQELENIIDNGSSGAEMECCIEAIIAKVKNG